MLSRRNVRGVRCEIAALSEVVATRPALLRLRLANELRAGTAQSLFFLHDPSPDLSGSTLEAGESATWSSRRPFAAGVFREADAGLLSRFPIGLFRKYGEHRDERDRRLSGAARHRDPGRAPRGFAGAAGPTHIARGSGAGHPHSAVTSSTATIPAPPLEAVRAHAPLDRREREADRGPRVFLFVDNAWRTRPTRRPSSGWRERSRAARGRRSSPGAGRRVGFPVPGSESAAAVRSHDSGAGSSTRWRDWSGGGEDAPPFPPHRRGDHRLVIT